MENISFIKKELPDDKILTSGKATMLEAESELGPLYRKSESLKIWGKEFASKGIFVVTDKHLIFVDLFQNRAFSILFILGVIFLVIGIIIYYSMRDLGMLAFLSIFAIASAIMGYILKIFNFWIWQRNSLKEVHEYSNEVCINGRLRYGYGKVRIRIDENVGEIVSSLLDYKGKSVEDSDNLPHKSVLTNLHKFIIYGAIFVAILAIVFVVIK